VAAVECKGKKASAKGAPKHIKKMLEGPCPNHVYLIKHAYKDYGLMKKFLSKAPRRGGEEEARPPRG
jgi:hypothetical protein